MNKQNFITLTLIISGLAFNPAVAESVEFDRVGMKPTPTTQKQNCTSVASGISTMLYNKGLDEDVAEELAENLVEGEDEMYLSLLLQTLDVQNIVSHEDVLAYLGHAALHRQKIDLKKYDDLVGMVAQIQKKALDKQTLEALGYIAKVNKQLFA